MLKKLKIRKNCMQTKLYYFLLKYILKGIIN